MYLFDDEGKTMFCCFSLSQFILALYKVNNIESCTANEVNNDQVIKVGCHFNQFHCIISNLVEDGARLTFREQEFHCMMYI